MKHVYFSFLTLFITFLSHSQDEVELFGDWFLHYRTDNGIIIYPPLTIQEDYEIVLNFGLLPPTANHPFTIESNGPTTNTFNGKFEIVVQGEGIMQILNVNEVLNNCEHPPEVCSFFSDYNNAILLDPNTSEVVDEYFVRYDVTGTDENEVLTITNEFSGDIAVYGRQTLSISSYENRTVTVFPNPANNILNISNFNIDSYYSIYSIEGKLILDKSNLSQQVDISYLKPGLYDLRIEELQTIKFIKQ